ncbi:bifunctional hydroxymethylpyrimidine kinase/phosphomethylpyrimidine kinase [Balneolales bacterium ANBcel1]|nr:bifunctional hydroxymethylpyrimidine kinase/phosphomethylpyrimidine kinase [Balneolales bacterium ANBcel1]
MHPPKVLAIAGSDSGGGAGIQADLKTFSALQCYGMSVITALTAQNTRSVTAIHDVPSGFIRDQMEAVFSDIGVDAVKIGMLNRPEVIHTVTEVLSRYKPPHIVLDPVMVAKSGDRLLQDEAITALKTELLPLATLITPNLPEAGVLTGTDVTNRQQMEHAGRALLAMGPEAVLVKGGHLTGSDLSPDCLIEHAAEHPADMSDSSIQVTLRWYEMPRVETRNNHGTGCTLSSAITALLARGMSREQAVGSALSYVNRALRKSVDWQIGQGYGPVHHFHPLWPV